MHNPKILIAALVVVAVAVTVLFVLTPVPRPAASRPTEATNLVLRGYEEGHVTWETTADRGELAADASELSAIALRIFDGATTIVRASAQSLVEQQGVITLQGGVRGETTDDVKLSTDAMTWTERRETLEAGPTLLTSGSDELSAETFAYYTGRREAALTDVRGTLRRSSTLLFSSDRGVVSRDEISLDGNVRVTSAGGDVMLTAGSLVASDDGWTAKEGVSADIELNAEGDHGA